MPSHKPPISSPPAPDSIFALASGPGWSELALIRVSGPAVKPLLATLAPDPPFARGVPEIWLRLVRDPGSDQARLPCLLLLFPSPTSYTGEDSAELVLPGNPHLVDRVIRTLGSHPGVRDAGPGEFSARAYLNGKLSLDQAEGVAALIGARTDDQLLAARSLLAGAAGDRYRTWTDRAATLLALVEAGIDFTDQEDVVPISPADLSLRVGVLLDEITSALGARRGDEHPAHLPRIVLAGRPNAGKSTLFNALLGGPRALASPVAGTTRDALAETLDLSGDVPCGPAVTLVDLAGLDASVCVAPQGQADRSAQARAAREIELADAVILCDPTGRFDASLPGRQARPVLRVRTKADLPAALGPAPGTHDDSIGVCAIDGWNLGVLRRAIADAASASNAPGSWLLPRHRRTLDAAAQSLDRARATAAADSHARSLRSPELIARDLREAVDHLGELVGRISPDDIIGRVFATFCVGK